MKLSWDKSFLRTLTAASLSLAMGGLLCSCAGGGQTAVVVSGATQTTSPVLTIADQVGATNVAALYQYNPSESLLLEGRHRLASSSTEFGAGLGTHVMKLWFTRLYASLYPNTTGWGSINSMQDLAASTPYADTFSDPAFTTYMLEASEFCQKTSAGVWQATNWKTAAFATDTVTQQCVHDDFYNLTKYLLKTYNNSGKTFVLQNWESDNDLDPSSMTPQPAASNTCPSTDTTPYCVAVRNMILWFNLRQQGVTDARNAVAHTNVTVAAVAEVNMVTGYAIGWTWPTAIDLVVPSLSMDLYSCSCYSQDAPGTEYRLSGMLDYIHGKRKDSALYGSQNVYIGEFDTPENFFYTGGNNWTESSSQQARVVTGQQIENALRWGARWVVFWELYDNDWEYSSPTTYEGYWLIRPPGGGSDGKQPDTSQTWDYLQSVMGQNASDYRYIYEAENHVGTTTGGTALEVTDSTLSGGRGSWLSGAANGSTISYTAYVPYTQTYTLSIRMKTGPSNGMFTLRLDGTPVGGTYDTYSASAGTQNNTVLTGSFAAGTHTLQLVVSGQNPASAGHDLVTDSFRIAP